MPEATPGSRVEDDEVLWRRVPPGRKKRDPDDPSRWLPASDNFKGPKQDRGVSVDRAALHVHGGPEALLADIEERREEWGVIAVTAGDVRAEGFDVEPDPIDLPVPNQAHALIVPNLNGGQSKRLVKRAEWVVEPAPPPGDPPST